MKLKTDMGLKKIKFTKLKEPKLPSALPRNAKLDNVFKISKGRFSSKGMMTALRRRGTSNGMNMFIQGNKVFKPGLTKKKGRFNLPRLDPEISFGKIGGIGKRRIKQQKGLNPWGDFDGDGLINMLDCNPRNKHLQGPEHTLEDKLGPEDEFDPEMTEQPEPTTTEQPREDPDIAEQRRRLAFEQHLFKERSQLDKLDLRRRETETKLREAERKKKEQDKKKPTKAQQAGSALGDGITTISQASKSFGGFGVSQQKLVGATGMNASQYKILAALGKAPPLPPQTTVQPIQPQQTQQTQQTTVQQAQSNPQQGIQSPYSGRKVSYVRGPYRKSQQE